MKKFYIKKGGWYYRKNAQGYTDKKYEDGKIYSTRS